jgi:unsaturated rhamnogalacturonyl hydrolase
VTREGVRKPCAEGAIGPNQLAAHPPTRIAPEIVELAAGAVRRLSPARLPWSWGEGLLLYGLLRLDAELGESRFFRFVESYFDAHTGRRRAPVDWSDQCPPGLAALELYAITGRAEHLAPAERVVEYLRRAPRTREGGLNHFGSSIFARVYPRSMWVDSLMMYGVFAARWGLRMRDDEMTRFALEQPLHFARVLRDPQTGLFRHCFRLNARRAVPAGDGYWLRGNGWVLASLAEVLDAVPPHHAGRTDLIGMLAELSTAVFRHQLPSGLFPTVLGRSTYVETSGSALCVYGVLSGVHAGHVAPALRTPALRAYAALVDRLERRRNGVSMPDISGPTMPYPLWVYGLIPRLRDAPHGIAAMVLAAIAASRVRK